MPKYSNIMSVNELRNVLRLYKAFSNTTNQAFQDRIKAVVKYYGVDTVAEKLGKSKSTIQTYCKKNFIDRNRGFGFDSFVGMLILEYEILVEKEKEDGQS